MKTRDVLRDLGAARVAVWPDEVALNLWALPPVRLAELLADLVPVASEGPAAYYSDVLASVVGLAVHAPGGPPASSAGFPGPAGRPLAGQRLRRAAQNSAGEVKAAGGHVGDVRLRYRALFSRLGPGFDGRRRVTDFDALYCIVEGTARRAVGEAQALALTELVADAASSWAAGRPAGGAAGAG